MFAFDSFVSNERTPAGDARQLLVNGEEIANTTWDPGLRRPYRDDKGRVWVDVTRGSKARTDNNGTIVTNSSGLPIYDKVYEPQLVADRVAQGLPVLHANNATTLRKDQWIMLDSVVMTASRKRLRAWADLRASNTLGGFDGMATPILEHEIMNDPGEAVVDMDGLSEARNFAPEFELQGLPLPITHSDFYLSSRFLAASRSKGQPQDTLRAEMAGRRVGEVIEQTLIGTTTGITYGDSTDYVGTAQVLGYTNHGDRITKTDLTASASTNGETIVDEVLAMRELAYAQNFYGPFMMYVSTGYDAILDDDFKSNSDKTTRSRLREIDGINGVTRLDYLTGDVILLVQMTEDVAQAVNGLEITTVQWESKGGMQLNFKVMAIQVPRIRSTNVNQTTTKKAGIVHGTTS